MKIVECVPNFSEGRNIENINRIIDAIKSVEGVKVLDTESDKDHNRSVITFIGDPESVEEAAFRGCKKASELIDLNKHKGEHPRMGATDVIPFIPVSDVSMKECVSIAEKLGERIWNELKIPVYLYEEAARTPERKNLADIRKGEFEWLKENIEKRPPDFGDRIHPTAGATAVGAREFLIAFNVNLNTNDLSIAKKIAKAVRFKSGGFRYVKALGFEIKERGIVQVSMNLTNYKKTPIYRVFEAIKSEADRYGVSIIGSELIGLAPMDALLDVADFYLRLENFKKTQVLERRIWE
ncbi:MAG: glutamate formimidoyltransferase [Methanomicrobia archaeon]|nr:glutamate formimidoyltransferase [Methanomicrobia archaeon]